MSGTGLWYEGGIRFACRRCGRCCRDGDEPTYVFLHEGDIEPMAEFLEMETVEFTASYLVDEGGFLCLANWEGDCIFFDEEKGCRVYGARPIQCRTWPFWPENLKKWSWRCEVEELCPGVGKGPLHHLKDINRCLAQLRAAPLLTTNT